MNKLVKSMAAAGVFAISMLSSSASYANLTFDFAQVGGNVVMTSSGVLNTNNLVALQSSSGWGGIGIEHNSYVDIMGNTTNGSITQSFAFHQGTDFSAWDIANGPWSHSDFNVTSHISADPFTTYYYLNSQQTPGFGLRASDLVNGLWSDNQVWTFGGQTFSSLGLQAGSYTVSDSVTHESITFVVGQSNVPEPASLALVGLGLAGVVAARRKKQA